MNQSNLKNKQQAGRFALVGLINTAIDFVVLFSLRSFGLPIIPANFISSTVAFSFSFFANRSYTFSATEGNTPRQIISFIVVTLAGLWIVQNIIIHFTEPVASEVLNSSDLGLLLAKVVATAVSLIWNYVLYAAVVFRNTEQ